MESGASPSGSPLELRFDPVQHASQAELEAVVGIVPSAGLAFPLMFVVLYGYVLGGSMSVAGGGDYMDFLIPGLFTMTMAFGVGETIIGVNTHMEAWVTDRFRSMPISAGSMVLGRALADMVWATVNLAVLAICGLAVGWRWNGTSPRQ